MTQQNANFKQGWWSLTLDGMRGDGTVPPTEKHGWGNAVKLYFTHISDKFVCSLCFKFQVKILLCSEVLAISFFQKKLMVCGGDAYFKQVKNGDLNKCTLYIFVKS